MNSDHNAPDITGLLQHWQDGDGRAMEQLMDLVYRELRLISARYLNKERANHTLGATGLVNEAWCRMVDQNRVSWKNRAHFFGVAAQMMRRILINHAKEKNAAKRGGGVRHLSLDQMVEPILVEGSTVDLEALDEALKTLAAFDERKAKVVELKFFGGLTEEEMAHVLNLSPATIRREWRGARIWLFRFLKDH